MTQGKHILANPPPFEVLGTSLSEEALGPCLHPQVLHTFGSVPRKDPLR